MTNANLIRAASIFITSLFLAPSLLAEPFKVGVIVPLSGPVAEYGTAIVNGITLAKEQYPEKLARCDFSVDDSAYKTTQALAAFNKFQVGKGVGLVYVFGGPMGEALAPLAESRRTPLIIDHIDSKAAAGKKFVVRYANSERELGASLTRSLTKRGVKRVGLVVVDNQYIEALIAGFVEESKGLIEVETIARVTPDEGDLRHLAPKVRASKFDALGLFLLPAQASSLAKNLHLQGAILFGGDFMASPVPLQDANGALDGILFPNNLVDEQFTKAYGKRFGNEAHIKFAAEGFDVAMMLAELVCSQVGQNSAKPEEIMQRITSAPVRRAAQGETVFKIAPNGDRYFSAPVVTMIGRRSGFSVDR
jgi:branched-chain amino acid transport system substrate-binding protein